VIPQIHRGKDERGADGKIDPEERAPIGKGEPEGDQCHLGMPAGETIPLVPFEGVEDIDNGFCNAPAVQGGAVEGLQHEPRADGGHGNVACIREIISQQQGVGGHGELFFFSPEVENNNQRYRDEVI